MNLKIKSGYGTQTLPFWVVFNLYVIFVSTSVPGLAISPIMGELQKLFPGTTQLETQFLTLGPNIMCIPFTFLGGWIGTKFNNMRLLNWTCLFYGIGSVLFFFANSMIMLIVLSFLIGITAGIMSPLASAFIADLFGGQERTKQYGYTSAVLNLVLMVWVVVTGYLAKIDWRLPFIIYLLPIVPLFFAKGFAKYIKEPVDIRAKDASKQKVAKVHYKFSQQVNMPMLIRYCAYYFFITLVIAAISLYIPFRYSNPTTAGYLTSILFLGIMASGFTLNFCLKYLKNKVAVVVMAFLALGFVLMVISSDAVIVGIGILLATYFYGIAQPYYYDRLSQASTRVALTLTLAWFAVMDSIGNVIAPFVLDGIAKLLRHPTSSDPLMAFKICMWMCFGALAIVIVRQIIVRARHHDLEAAMVKPEDAAGPVATSAPSINPVPIDVPLKKVSADQAALYAANDAVKAAQAADAAAQAADLAAQQAVKAADSAAAEANAASHAAETVASELSPKPSAGTAESADKPSVNNK